MLIVLVSLGVDVDTRALVDFIMFNDIYLRLDLCVALLALLIKLRTR